MNETPTPQTDRFLIQFLARAERERARREIAEATMSKLLFGNSRTLQRLLAGSRSVELSTLTDAEAALTALEAEPRDAPEADAA